MKEFVISKLLAFLCGTGGGDMEKNITGFCGLH